MNDVLIHERVYRGDKILGLMASTKLVMCGAGAVGSNLVDSLSRQGFRSISVIDDDRVEAHNIPTQVWSRREVGQQKAVMLKNLVFNSTGSTIEAIASRLDNNNAKKHLSNADLVIDGFDNNLSRGVVQSYCRSAKKECLHVGLAKDYAEVIWDDGYRVPRDTVGLDICDYPMARNTISLAVAVAAEVIVRYVATRIKNSYVITLGDFKIEQI